LSVIPKNALAYYNAGVVCSRKFKSRRIGSWCSTQFFNLKLWLGRVLELENELRKLRTDADARIRGVEEEAHVVKKKLVVEIESLTVRLQVGGPF
jgi:hypothetical protein